MFPGGRSRSFKFPIGGGSGIVKDFFLTYTQIWCCTASMGGTWRIFVGRLVSVWRIPQKDMEFLLLPLGHSATASLIVPLLHVIAAVGIDEDFVLTEINYGATDLQHVGFGMILGSIADVGLNRKDDRNMATAMWNQMVDMLLEEEMDVFNNLLSAFMGCFQLLLSAICNFPMYGVAAFDGLQDAGSLGAAQ